ncbi:unnamed protein product [Amoebophrya sp. A120]|nr:unnamed protein product [Amoebophrya sp. A120]|eukprot:GSA120T00020905001.1
MRLEEFTQQLLLPRQLQQQVVYNDNMMRGAKYLNELASKADSSLNMLRIYTGKAKTQAEAAYKNPMVSTDLETLQCNDEVMEKSYEDAEQAMRAIQIRRIARENADTAYEEQKAVKKAANEGKSVKDRLLRR